MKNLLLAVATCALLTACDDPQSARLALSNAGFTDITVGGYAAFYCGKDDAFSTKFRAKNPQGRFVEGAIAAYGAYGFIQ